jgi:hypothetical protein
VNVLEHAIDVREHFIVPVAQDPVAVRLESSRPLCVGGQRHSVLTAIDLHDDALAVAREIDDVSSNLNLPAKMRARHYESVSQVPPEFSFCFGRCATHLPSELPLSRHLRAIPNRPDSRLVLC